MLNLGRAVLPVVLLFGIPNTGWAQDDQSAPSRPVAGAQTAQEWLNRMAVAMERLNYIATFVYSNGKALQSMQVVHRYQNGQVRERLISLSGPPREVLRDNALVTCILPDDKAVLVAASTPRDKTRTALFNPSAGVHDHYQLSTSPGARVAGRPTQVVEVIPRDAYRYGYRLSLDLETALPLSSELVGERGRALERIVYTNVDLPEQITDQMLRPESEADGFTWYRRNESGELRPSEVGGAWQVKWLPEGFQSGPPKTQSTEDGSGWTHHLMFSDGVASLSVFIERLPPGGEGMEGISTMGATNAFGRVVDGVQITVVGEVPARTVQHVGRSVALAR